MPHGAKMKDYGSGGEGHAPGPSTEFIGPTKGNRDLAVDRSYEALGGEGESHSDGPETEFLGYTKGNYDLPIDRSYGVEGGYGGGQHKAGGTKKAGQYDDEGKEGGMSYGGKGKSHGFKNKASRAKYS